MKYHFKSPEEIQQYLREERAKSTGRFRNRGFWIILLDIVIIVIVIGILYYSGLLSPQAVGSLQTEHFDHLEFSISLPALRADRETVSIYLNVKNTGQTPREFPPAEGAVSLSEIKSEFFAGDFFLHSDSLTGGALPAPGTIAPGATRIFDLPVRFPLDKRKGNFSFLIRLHLVLEGRIVTLPLPGVQVKK